MSAGGAEFTWWGEGKEGQALLFVGQSGKLGNRAVCELFLVVKGKRRPKLVNGGSGKQNLQRG